MMGCDVQVCIRCLLWRMWCNFAIYPGGFAFLWVVYAVYAFMCEFVCSYYSRVLWVYGWKGGICGVGCVPCIYWVKCMDECMDIH